MNMKKETTDALITMRQQNKTELIKRWVTHMNLEKCIPGELNNDMVMILWDWPIHVHMDDIVLCLQHNICWDTFFAWWTYCSRLSHPRLKDVKKISLLDWSKGGSRLSDEELEHLLSIAHECDDAQQTVDDAFEVLHKGEYALDNLIDYYMNRPHTLPPL